MTRDAARKVARIIKRLEWYADTMVDHLNRRLIAKEAVAALRALLAENAAVEQEAARLREVVVASRDRFREYERLHAAKPDMDKARRNAEMAEMCERALAAAAGASVLRLSSSGAKP